MIMFKRTVIICCCVFFGLTLCSAAGPGGRMTKKDRYAGFIASGDAYLSEHQYARAIETYQEAAQLLPRLEKAHLRLAAVYEASDLTELARQEYLTVLSRDRRSYEAYFRLAEIYRTEGLITRAMEYYRRALTLKPGGEVYRAMSQCADVSGDVGLALAMLKHIPPEERTFDDLLAIGRLFREKKCPENAEDAFSQAIKLAPDKAEGYIFLGLLYLGNKDLTRAEKLLQIAQEKAPEEGIVRFYLGNIYYKQGNKGRARAEMKEARRLARTDMLKLYSARFADFLSFDK